MNEAGERDSLARQAAQATPSFVENGVQGGHIFRTEVIVLEEAQSVNLVAVILGLHSDRQVFYEVVWIRPCGCLKRLEVRQLASLFKVGIGAREAGKQLLFENAIGEGELRNCL